MSIWIAFHLSQFGDINGAISLKLTPEKNLNWNFWRWFFFLISWKKNVWLTLWKRCCICPSRMTHNGQNQSSTDQKRHFVYSKMMSVFFPLKTQKKSVQKTMSTHGFSLENLKLRITYAQHYLFFSIIFSWETEKEPGERRRTSCFSDLNMWTE